MQKIAAFDFDGTITRKDTLWEFLKFSQSKLKLYVGLICLSPVLTLFLFKIVSNNRAKEILFSWFFKKWEIERFNSVCSSFSKEIDQCIRPETLTKIQAHKEEGDDIVIISASVENWIIPWATNAGIKSVLATKIETDSSGLITGKFLSKNCYGQEKVNRLLEKYPERNSYFLYAYGDSKGDKQLIEFADEGYYV